MEQNTTNDKFMMVNTQGIAGKQINVFSRIVSVADVFDAVSHKCCNKEA